MTSVEPTATTPHDDLFSRYRKLHCVAGIVVPALQVAKYLASQNEEDALHISKANKPVVRINFYDAGKAAILPARQ